MNQEKVLIAKVQEINTTLVNGITVDGITATTTISSPDLTDIKTNTSDTVTNTADIVTNTALLSTVTEPIHLTQSLIDHYNPGVTKCVVMGGAKLDSSFAPVTLSNSGYIQNDIAKIAGSGTSVNVGSLDPGTQRVCIASDDVNLFPMNTNLSGLSTLVTAWNSGYVPAVNVNLRGVQYGAGASDIAVGAGNNNNATVRVCIGTDDVNLAAIKTATEQVANTINMAGFQAVDIATINGTVVTEGAGNVGAGTQRVAIATDDINLASINAILTDVWDSTNHYLRVHTIP